MKRSAPIKPTFTALMCGVIISTLVLLLNVGMLWMFRAPSEFYLLTVPFVIACVWSWWCFLREDAPAMEHIELRDAKTQSGSPVERMQQLQELRDQELISPAEFESKRVQILRDL